MNPTILVLTVGGVIILVMFLKLGLERSFVPPLVGYMLTGFFLRLINPAGLFGNGDVMGIFRFLAEVGIITLLFRTGLESDLKGLIGISAGQGGVFGGAQDGVSIR